MFVWGTDGGAAASTLWLENGNKIYYNTDNVGIGTNAPAFKLDVHGTANVGALTATTLSVGGAAVALDADMTANAARVDALYTATTGDIIYATGTDTLGKLNIGGTTGHVLKVSASGTPEWAAESGGGGGGGGSSQWTGTTEIYFDGNVGIANTNPDHTLSVGSNLYVDDTGSNVLVVDGNVAAESMTIGGISIVPSYPLSSVTDTGNVTPHTIEFTNATTGIVTTGNVVVAGNVTAAYLYGDASNVTGIASNLHQIVENGNVTSNTVQFTNATTGLVTTANVEIGGELTVTGNLHIDGFVGTSRTGGLIVPSGTTGELPSGVTGMIRYNTELEKLQVSNGSTWLTVGGFNAIGGTITNVDGYTIHTFLSGGTFTVLSGGDVEYLVIAGGGGGGNAHGTNGVGGGGAGGMLTGTLTNITSDSYTIIVGGGGAGTSSNQTNGSNGSDSNISTLIVATGGGGGGAAENSNGLDGGSGGGAGTFTTSSTVAQTGGSGISGQGNDGRSTNGVVGHGGGGGGGAGSAAPAIPVNGVGGAGGSGLTSSISGTSTVYAGGGGGTGWLANTAGSGGSGGGGSGGTTGSDGVNGTVNSGGGGGGCKTTQQSGNGGSGIVIIRYLS